MTDMKIETDVEIGKSGIKVTPLGLGAWAWGDKIFWGFGSGYAEADVRGAFLSSVEAGIHFIDTAEVYGNGVSERLTGQFIREYPAEADRQPYVIATKFFPLPWRWTPKAVVNALRASLRRLGLESVDLYQVHQPFPAFMLDTWTEGLAAVMEAGLARAVGVSNYNTAQTRRAYELLEKRGIALASNQVEYSLLDRRIEKNGLYDLCRQMGISIIAYSPIAKGVLTGKYTPKAPPPGIRGRIYNREYLEKIQPLLALMRDIGQQHGSKTPGQVALNWTICKGTIPIPGAKNSRQALENAGALGWRLTPDEVRALEAASESG